MQSHWVSSSLSLLSTTDSHYCPSLNLDQPCHHSNNTNFTLLHSISPLIYQTSPRRFISLLRLVAFVYDDVTVPAWTTRGARSHPKHTSRVAGQYHRAESGIWMATKTLAMLVSQGAQNQSQRSDFQGGPHTQKQARGTNRHGHGTLAAQNCGQRTQGP